MTAQASSVTGAAWPPAALDRTRLLQAAAVFSVVALWFWTRPYLGIWHDASIYMGRVAADLDPHGVGRDLMFVNDGQFSFSLFPTAARELARAAGVDAAAWILTLGGLVVWLAAASALLRRIGQGSSLWVMLICVAALPADYGGMDALRYGEAIATPRVFAEAAVMAALAALISGRRLLAGGVLAGAALFHPIMAATGAAVLLLTLCIEDRRWWLLAGLGAFGGVMAAALGAPVLGRLFTSFDPEWREAIETWPSLVFFAGWSPSTWSQTAVQVVALAIGATLVMGRARLVLGAVLGVVAFGMLAGDGWGSVLLTQLQPWRVLWLAAVLGAALTGLAGTSLWSQGPAGRLCLAALALAWAGLPNPWLASLGAALALGARIAMLRRTALVKDDTLAVAVAGAAVVIALADLTPALTALLTPGFSIDLLEERRFLRLELHGVVLAVGAVALALSRGRWTGFERALGVAALALLAGALAGWDVRSPQTRARDTGADGRELRALLAPAPGPVLWLGDQGHTWLVAERPSYWTVQQGIPRVFSRELAIQWRARGDRLRALKIIGPYGAEGRPEAWESLHGLWPGPVARLCGSEDAPAWIIAPRSLTSPKTPAVRYWRPVGGPTYAVVPCAPAPPSRWNG